MREHLRPAIMTLVVLILLNGLAYPLAVTGIAQVVFPQQANGSLIYRDIQPVGSELIGQPFDDPKYFWGRLSATTPFPYNAGSSSGSNYGPLNPALLTAAQVRLKALYDYDPANGGAAPVDLVTSSGSGLDPHISVAAALFQVPRVAHARNLDENSVGHLVALATEGRQYLIWGVPRVNVLLVNLALDHRLTLTGPGTTPEQLPWRPMRPPVRHY